MSLAIGTQLGPYEILAPIGAGGMGEVCRARDTKPGRDVALKVLPEAFAHHVDRRARFEREAQGLASLNHSNISAIHGRDCSHCFMGSLARDAAHHPAADAAAHGTAGVCTHAGRRRTTWGRSDPISLGKLLFDMYPFGGSGSAVIACEKTGRQARVIELDPKYVDRTILRWQEFTGLEAVLDGDGRTFREVGRERGESCRKVAKT
jgi:hypothetical protein